VVSKHSAPLGLPGEIKSPLGGDYRSMVIPRSLEDTGFEPVWRAIRDIIPGPGSIRAGINGGGLPDTGISQQTVYFMVPFSRNERTLENPGGILG
jgi:hypothetical protein